MNLKGEQGKFKKLQKFDSSLCINQSYFVMMNYKFS